MKRLQLIQTIQGLGMIFMMALGLNPWAYADQDVVDVVIKQESTEIEKSIARQKMIDGAVREASLNAIRDMIGAEKLEKNLSVIDSKIIRNYGRFVPVVREQSSEYLPQGSKMVVALKISKRNLETMLLEAGLFYKLEGAPKVLPMITFFDQVNSQALNWWSEGQGGRLMLSEMQANFYKRLREDFSELGFYTLDPSRGAYRLALPSPLNRVSPPTEDYLFAGAFFQSQIVLKGSVIIRSVRDDVYRLDWNVAALQVVNGRLMSEITRSFESDKGVFSTVVAKKLNEAAEKVAQDLSAELSEAWKSGTFGANLVRIAVEGDMTPAQWASFKRSLLDQVKDLKTLRERLFEPGRTTFEADTSLTPQNLALAFRGKSFPQFRVQVGPVENDVVNLSVKSL